MTHQTTSHAIFVYGTLMRGQSANGMLQGCTCAGRYMLRDHALTDLGAFPAVTVCPGEAVLGEVWFVTDEMLHALDRYESEGTLYTRCPVNVENHNGTLACEVYRYLGTPRGRRIPLVEQPWNSADSEIWYAGYGSNLLPGRMACYLAGGLCRQNGNWYAGCRDRTLWKETRAATLPGRLYFGNRSGIWNGGGVAFYAPDPRSRVAMQLYRITREQLLDVQQQEGCSPQWYGRILCLGLADDGLPIVTLTSASPRPEHTPDETYLQILRLGLQQTRSWTEEQIEQYLRSRLPKPKQQTASPHRDPAHERGIAG